MTDELTDGRTDRYPGAQKMSTQADGTAGRLHGTWMDKQIDRQSDRQTA